MKINSVSAVIILYNPNFAVLKKSLLALNDQVDNIFLIDNTVDNKKNIDFIEGINIKGVTYFSLGKNEGVAKAQNTGINLSIREKSKYVLIMDQDSVPSKEMVTILMEDLFILKSKGFKIGVIGPTPINVQTQEPYSPRFRKQPLFLEKDCNILKVTELISSGSLIEIETLKIVGLMDEHLFIDGVDHEWCWRAKKFGFYCAMSNKARLEHMLGEGDKKIFGFRVAITSPFRIYYQYRNFIYLIRKRYVPLYWKFNNMIKYLIKLIYYPLFIKPRFLYLKNMIKGINDGLTFKV